MTSPEAMSRRRARVTGLVIALAGTAVFGLVGGLIWGELAPRALLQEVSPGAAEVVNAESRAFIGADGWFCVITAVAGVLTGVLGYRLGIWRREPATKVAVTVGLILGALAGAFVMRWLGEQIGLSGYQHQLADNAAGTTFNASLTLGAKSALAFWPGITSLVIVIGEVGSNREPGQPDAIVQHADGSA